jgi:hypothetical protein
VYHITTDDEFDRMPPVDSIKSLADDEKDLITRWIEAGAEWGQHWSFEPIIRPEVVVGSDAETNPIDVIVRRELWAREMEPSAEADSRSLIRRVSLDLTGLPPTPEEVADFVNDTAPGAFGTVVDRLLASPAYGERMAWD